MQRNFSPLASTHEVFGVLRQTFGLIRSRLRLAYKKLRVRTHWFVIPLLFGYCVFGNQPPFIRNYLRFFGRDFGIWVRDCRLNSSSSLSAAAFGRMPPNNVMATPSAGDVRAFGTDHYSFPNFSVIRRRRLHSRR